MSPSGSLLSKEIKIIVSRSLEEDIGTGDITTESIQITPLSVKADAKAKQMMTLCGEEFFKEVFRQIDPQIKIIFFYNDGDLVKKGSTLMTLEGDAKSILKGERTALNLLQHLSGIATLTKNFVEVANPVKILDTRKTHPGLRRIEKYAVICGGGINHRFGLYDAVLIKDNHIKVAGGIKQAITQIRDSLGKNCFIEIELTNLEEVRVAIEQKPNRILLDNMTITTIRQAVEIISGRSEIEVSGSIILDRVAELSMTGIDYISVGALTHSAPWADISLNFAD
tara:strand:- start:4683 stop:5528 length:846 start_codon:yes stop_codon:yes gene_type:complete